MGIEDDREAALRVHRELNSLGIRRTRQARQISQPRQPSPPKKQSAIRIGDTHRLFPVVTTDVVLKQGVRSRRS
jgi:hypothetical protein